MTSAIKKEGFGAKIQQKMFEQIGMKMSKMGGKARKMANVPYGWPLLVLK